VKSITLWVIGITILVFTQCVRQKQVYYIEGYAKDTKGNPIAYANVRVPINTETKESARANTNADGYYKIKLPVDLKKIRIGITIAGYQPTTNIIGSSCVRDTVFTEDDLKTGKGVVKMPDALFRLTGHQGAILVRGRLLDADTGEPVAGAKKGMSMTNRLGYYTFLVYPHPDSIKIRFLFQKDGYAKMEYDTTIVASKGEIVHIHDLKMKKNN